MLVCAEYAFGDCCVWQNDVHYWYGCSNEQQDIAVGLIVRADASSAQVPVHGL